MSENIVTQNSNPSVHADVEIQQLKEKLKGLQHKLNVANVELSNFKTQHDEFQVKKQQLNNLEISLREQKEKARRIFEEFKQKEQLFAVKEKSLDEKEQKLQEMDNYAVEIQRLQVDNQSLQQQLLVAQRYIASLENQHKDFQQRNRQLNELELSLSQKEQNIYQESELLKQQQELNNVQKTTLLDTEERVKRLQEDNQKLQQQLEQQRIGLIAELEELRQAKLSDLAQLESQKHNELHQKIQAEYNKYLADFDREFSNQKEQLTKDIHQLELDKQKNEIEQQRLDSREELLNHRESHIEQEIAEQLRLERDTFEKRLAELNQSNERLRESIKNLENERNAFADLESRLNGENPLVVLAEIETQKTLIFQLQEELRERPSKEVQDTLAILQNEKQSLLNENQYLREENSNARNLQQVKENLEFEKNRAIQRMSDIQGELEYAQAQINKLQEEISLLSKPFGTEQNRQQRIDSLLNPPQIELVDRLPYENIIETEWLDNIYQHCQDSGFEFPKRILNAFHTSLKTGEFSPITVLAGVSGTGKSQLPALYSKFGGINFINVPVQPNWDSQEAMLGYFNSMTNHFDAQPVLKFLMQTQQERTVEYPHGLKDMMNLILLDEMNLSHPELYFAEFLSKLEERRGKTELPSIDINLGSGIPSCNLPLRRNVLWVGTMNQDETTKSLSDKVIDRSFIINFPRPKNLKSLNVKNMSKAIKASDGLHYLTYKAWHGWVKYESLFNEKEIADYKNIIEQINDHMDKAGRALGHRVWQSVEYYMSNHPDVIVAHSNNDEDALKKNMKIAFEDQLVQKVMPKLRGIETRGRTSKNCLEPIQNLLDNEGFAIVEDFKHAREVGHGQFIWNSAYYLEDDATSDEE